MDKTATLLTLKSALRSSSAAPKPMLLAAVNGKLQQQQQKRDLHRTSGKDGKSRRQQHKARSSTSPEGHHSQVPSKYTFSSYIDALFNSEISSSDRFHQHLGLCFPPGGRPLPASVVPSGAARPQRDPPLQAGGTLQEERGSVRLGRGLSI